MSDYGELVKRLRDHAEDWSGDVNNSLREAARAIESLLAEKASARDEALEEICAWMEKHRRPDELRLRAGEMTGQEMRTVQAVLHWCIASIRALRSPAKEKADG